MGDSKRPLNYLIAAPYHIVLDLLFVAALGLGAAGAAIATVISQLLSCLLVVRALRRLPESYRLSLKSLRPDKMSLANIQRLGLPTGSGLHVLRFKSAHTGLH
jgi:Na+-driven multidrug efflux pump